MILLKTYLPRLAATALTALLIPVIGGCGGDGLAKRYAVYGKVTHKGEALAHGEIQFVPADPTAGRAAGGVITDGAYQLTTQDENDGAMPGKYKVTVSAKNVDLTKAMAKSKALGTNIIIPGQLAKANKAAKNLVPSKYGLPDTSGLSAEVKEQSNSLDFDLPD